MRDENEVMKGSPKPVMEQPKPVEPSEEARQIIRETVLVHTEKFGNALRTAWAIDFAALRSELQAEKDKKHEAHERTLQILGITRDQDIWERLQSLVKSEADLQAAQEEIVRLTCDNADLACRHPKACADTDGTCEWCKTIAELQAALDDLQDLRRDYGIMDAELVAANERIAELSRQIAFVGLAERYGGSK